MQVLVDSIKTETPRPKSPHMNNEEPINLAHFPAAKRPPPGEQSKIDRDDFPAPPYPYSDPERRRRWSDSYKGVPISDEEGGVKEELLSPVTIDEVDCKVIVDKQLKREEKELSKIATGIGKVFLQNVREREKMRQWKMSHLDPRNASRTPSANKEPMNRLRYESPINACELEFILHDLISSLIFGLLLLLILDRGIAGELTFSPAFCKRYLGMFLQTLRGLKRVLSFAWFLLNKFEPSNKFLVEY
jgi:actin-binding LIM protein